LPCRECNWGNPETYIVLVLDIIYAYNALMLIFGLAHCLSLFCGTLEASSLLMQDDAMQSEALERSDGKPLKAWFEKSFVQYFRKLTRIKYQ